jgi:hypothetical protein
VSHWFALTLVPRMESLVFVLKIPTLVLTPLESAVTHLQPITGYEAMFLFLFGERTAEIRGTGHVLRFTKVKNTMTMQTQKGVGGDGTVGAPTFCLWRQRCRGRCQQQGRSRRSASSCPTNGEPKQNAR